MPPIFVEYGQARTHPLETAFGTPAWDILPPEDVPLAVEK
jgi:hypothetical protein